MLKIVPDNIMFENLSIMLILLTYLQTNSDINNIVKLIFIYI